ncbi:RidA family protein [Burkholderia diffusa]|uniref:RidA family protein n=1 Tax=Burkholderia diffusa TaxID=488732 RepID=UPI0026525E3B|nr:RidA family protein [Burkholderia diffusa]MDN7902615.1 RidA family protein [Burkholderia diffusa]
MKTTVWLEDARDVAEFNRVHREFFPGNKPSRSTLQATNMAGTRIEIEAIACRPWAREMPENRREPVLQVARPDAPTHAPRHCFVRAPHKTRKSPTSDGIR